MSKVDKIKEAKKASIFDIWEKINLPGIPASSCKSPFREDSSPSFFISSDGKYWRDYGTGRGGDSVDFVAEALQLGVLESSDVILKLSDNQQIVVAPKPVEEKERLKPVLPEMSLGNDQMLKMLSNLRGFDVEALIWARQLGILRFCEYKESMCWVVTDSEGYSAQARRLDGLLFENGAKSITMFGSWASWPLGLTKANNGYIFLTEGGPDLLSSINYTWKLGLKLGVRFGCMLGASQRIHKKALSRFRGAKVLIFAHNDAQGLAAFENWKSSLAEAKSVTRFNYYVDVKDLNEMLQKVDFETARVILQQGISSL